MAKRTLAYVDAKGGLHPNAVSATVSDLTVLLGNNALARQIVDNRRAIEDILTQHDSMVEDESDGGSFRPRLT